MSFIGAILLDLTTGNLIAATAVAVTVIAGIIYLIFNSGRIIQRVDTIESDVSDIRVRVRSIPALKNQVDLLWRAEFGVASSPMALNDKGEKILEQSGIEAMIRLNYDLILAQAKECNPENAYQAQECIIESMNILKTNKECVPRLEKGAFDSGSDITTILFVGAIFIRDEMLPELGFKREDVDKGDPAKKAEN